MYNGTLNGWREYFSTVDKGAAIFPFCYFFSDCFRTARRTSSAIRSTLCILDAPIDLLGPSYSSPADGTLFYDCISAGIHGEIAVADI